jgi:hypothetical protein
MAASKSEVAALAALERRVDELERTVQELMQSMTAPPRAKEVTNGKIAPHVGR